MSQIDDKPATDEAGIIIEAIQRFKLASDAEDSNRVEALTDLKFADGDQWPQDVKRDRDTDARPCLTINITDAMVRRVTNACRENRPRIRTHPVGDGADVQTSKVWNGLIRHIEVASNADFAYDSATESAVRGGWGYFRVGSRYVDEKSFDQDLTIDRIRNPFTVYMDPGVTSPDGSDQAWCLVSEMMRRDDFRQRFGKDAPYNRIKSIAASAWNFMGGGDNQALWSTKEHIRVAEYWRVEPKEDTLLLLSTNKNILKSQFTKDAKELASEHGITVLRERKTLVKKVCWYLLTADEVLDRRDWPGKFIPIIPVYGRELDLNGKVVRKGMVRDLRDPARMFNYAETSKTEVYALQPKAPWLGPKGFMEGKEAGWRDANRKPIVALEYIPIQNPDGSMAPPPARQNPPTIAAGFQEWAQSSQSNFLVVAGMPNDPGADAKGEVVSGIAMRKRQGLSDISHYDFYDNLTRSLRHCGTILVDLIPHFYDTARMQRIIGDDGTPTMVQLNQQVPDPQNQAMMKVKNDTTSGRYDIVIDTGPSYQTKREESVEAKLELLATPLGEMVAKVAGDVMVRGMDFDDADTVADRLAAMIPGAQIDKNSDIPPNAQMMIKSLQAQLQQANQRGMALEMELQAKHGIALIREQGETHRLNVKEQHEDVRQAKELALRAHEVGLEMQTKVQDTATRAVTAIDVAGIKETGSLMKTHIDNKHEKELAKETAKDAKSEAASTKD